MFSGYQFALGVAAPKQKELRHVEYDTFYYCKCQKFGENEVFLRRRFADIIHVLAIWYSYQNNRLIKGYLVIVRSYSVENTQL